MLTIKQSTKWALATLLVAGACGSAFAQTRVDNWTNAYGQAWRSGDSSMCWRDGFWTPATAAAGCDGAVVAPAPSAPAPAPKVEAPAAAPVSEKVTYAADTFFDFDKAVLKPAGKAALDDLSSKIKGVTLETVISTGYTDSFGPVKYNLKLSERRAEAVKAYLVSKGVAADKVYVEGKGKSDYRVDPKTCKGSKKARIACQQPNRRTVVEIVGSHMVTK